MPTIRPFQNNFTSGEISPDLNGRVDVKQYRNGCHTMTDAIPTLEGGFVGRPGLRYLFPLKDQTQSGLLIPFEFSITETFGIVLNAQSFWFITEQILLTEPVQTITNILSSTGGAVRIEIVGHGYSTGDWVSLSNITGTTEANTVFGIIKIDNDNFDLVGSLFLHPWSGGGGCGKIVQITTDTDGDSLPYGESDFQNLRWAQDGNVLYIVDGKHIPYQLTRVTPISFTLTKFQPNGPYSNDDKFQTSTTTLTFGGIVDKGTISTLTASQPLWTLNDVGRVVKMAGDTGIPLIQGYLRITNYLSDTIVTAQVLHKLTSSVATITWSLGAWNTVDGFPSSTTFHEQRLLMGGITSKIQKWWGSFLNSPEDFVGDEPFTNDDMYTYTVRSEKINAIRWMASLGDLLIGTAGEELKVVGPADLTIGPVIAPIIKSQTKRGSGNVRPLLIEGIVMFLQWGDRRLYTLQFDVDQAKLNGQDLTFISRHLVPEGKTITRIVYEEQPNNIVWALRSDGVLLTMVFFPEQEVLGWSSHSTVNGLFEDVMALPSILKSRHDTYTIVKRTLDNGSIKRYVEVFDKNLYVDSGLSGTINPASSTIIGFNHLIGETIRTRLDEGDGGSFVVDPSGQIILDHTVVKIQGGYSFNPTVIPLEPAQDTTSFSNDQFIGRKKKYGSLIIRTKNTTTFAINNMIQSTRKGSDLMDTAPSVDQIEDWRTSELGYKTITSFSITQPLPQPIHVLLITGTMTVGET